jgi:hypothetical protein
VGQVLGTILTLKCVGIITKYFNHIVSLELFYPDFKNKICYEIFVDKNRSSLI